MIFPVLKMRFVCSAAPIRFVWFLSEVMVVFIGWKQTLLNISFIRAGFNSKCWRGGSEWQHAVGLSPWWFGVQTHGNVQFRPGRDAAHSLKLTRQCYPTVFPNRRVSGHVPVRFVWFPVRTDSRICEAASATAAVSAEKLQQPNRIMWRLDLSAAGCCRERRNNTHTAKTNLQSRDKTKKRVKTWSSVHKGTPHLKNVTTILKMGINLSFTFEMRSLRRDRRSKCNGCQKPHHSTSDCQLCCVSTVTPSFLKRRLKRHIKAPHPTWVSLMNLANSAHVSAMPKRDLPARAFHLHLNKSTADPRPAKTPFWVFF